MVQSNLSTTAILGTSKKWPLFKRQSLVAGCLGSDWVLLTGGSCSEVVVNTGLTVLTYIVVIVLILVVVISNNTNKGILREGKSLQATGWPPLV
jgi:hypothetical protein